MSDKFKRRSGAFDRFNSFQIDSAGRRVLSHDPITKEQEIEHIYAQNEAANRARVIRMERELARQKLLEQQQLAKAALEAEYRRMIAEAMQQGFLIDEKPKS